MKSTKKIIRRPIITEKASWMKETQNMYVFEVDNNCNKIEIKNIIEGMFNVKVEKVHTYSTHGKVRTRGRFRGRRADLKRAIVHLKEGDTIEYFEGV